ncbi:hypothetical protein JZ751_003498, partial [Albula glossodonta]
MDVRPMEIRWYRPSQHHNPILLYKDQQIQLSSKNQQYQGRVSLMGLEPGVGGLEDGNIALILTDVTALDSGKYECYVGSDQWYETGLISLIVKNVGSIPVLSVYPSNKEEQVNVSCMSQNWSPEPRVTWRDDKGTELKNQKSSYTTDSQGLVAVSSWLLFSSDSGWLSCGVSISGGDSRESRVTPVSISCPSAGTGWMAAFIALLLFSMLAIAVLSVLFTKSRRKGPKEPERNDTELETKALLVEVNILLDKSTAHVNLKISDAMSMIYTSDYRGAIASSKRFSHHTCVLGSRGFSSGQQYWEVQLEDAEKKEVKKSWNYLPFFIVHCEPRMRVWLILLTALAIPQPAAMTGQFSVSVPSGPVSVWLGDSVTLPCSVTPPMDVRPMEVRWYRTAQYSNPILLYKDHQIQPTSQNHQYQGRVSLMGLESGMGGLRDGDVSLILRNITPTDSGKYECYVNSDLWYEIGLISLQLKKLGSAPVLSVHPTDGGGGQQVNVTCVSEGWTHDPRLIWRDSEGRELKHQHGPFYTTDSQGLVTVNSWLLFSPSDSGWLSCSVSLSGGDSRESRVTPVSFPSPGIGWMAAFISLLVLSLLAIAVLSVLFIKSKKREKLSNSSAGNDTTQKQQENQPSSSAGNNTAQEEQGKQPSSSAASAETEALLIKEGVIHPIPGSIQHKVRNTLLSPSGSSISDLNTGSRQRAATGPSLSVLSGALSENPTQQALVSTSTVTDGLKDGRVEKQVTEVSGTQTAHLDKAQDVTLNQHTGQMKRDPWKAHHDHHQPSQIVTSSQASMMSKQPQQNVYARGTSFSKGNITEVHKPARGINLSPGSIQHEVMDGRVGKQVTEVSGTQTSHLDNAHDVGLDLDTRRVRSDSWKAHHDIYQQPRRVPSTQPHTMHKQPWQNDYSRDTRVSQEGVIHPIPGSIQHKVRNTLLSPSGSSISDLNTGSRQRASTGPSRSFLSGALSENPTQQAIPSTSTTLDGTRYRGVGNQMTDVSGTQAAQSGSTEGVVSHTWRGKSGPWKAPHDIHQEAQRNPPFQAYTTIKGNQFMNNQPQENDNSRDTFSKEEHLNSSAESEAPTNVNAEWENIRRHAGFSSGQHYWEVQLEDAAQKEVKKSWSVGARMRRKHSVWLIVLTALVVPLPAATIENFVLEVPSTPVSVWLGDPVTLPCSVRPPMDIRPLEVRWYRPTHYHNPVLLYKDRKVQTTANEPQYQGRVSLMGLESGVGGLEVGIASLILRNVTAADCGEYECYVGSDQWYDTGHISLQLSKLGSVPILVAQLNDKGERQQVNVTCVSEGWTPKPRLIWRDNSQGLVTVSSWLLFSPSDSGWLSCSVSLSGGDSRESRVALRVPVPFPSPEAVPQSAGWMAAFISLLVLSLLAITVLSVLLIKSNKRGNITTDQNTVAENIVLNPETAHMNLKIYDLKSVVYGHENINTSSRRFLKHTCVLGDPGFSSGQHYWEVQLEDAEKKE